MEAEEDDQGDTAEDAGRDECGGKPRGIDGATLRIERPEERARLGTSLYKGYP